MIWIFTNGIESMIILRKPYKKQSQIVNIPQKNSDSTPFYRSVTAEGHISPVIFPLDKCLFREYTVFSNDLGHLRAFSSVG